MVFQAFYLFAARSPLHSANMPSDPDDVIQHLAKRITALEEYWTHLERTVQQLDEVLRSVQDRLDRLEGRIDRIAERKREPDSEEDEDAFE